MMRSHVDGSAVGAGNHVLRGTLLAVLMLALTLVAAASSHAAQVSITPGSFTTQLSTNQAGAHPNLHTTFSLDRDPSNAPLGGTPRDLHVDLPKGFAGAANATPTCPMARVLSFSNPCPLDSAVGEVTATLYYFGLAFPISAVVYNVTPDPGEPAALAFFALYPVRLDTSVRSDGDYGLTTSSFNLTEGASLLGVDMTLWGVPADHNGPGGSTEPSTGRPYGGPGSAPRRTFFTNPSECNGASLTSGLSMSTWQSPDIFASTSYDMGAITGCDRLTFGPKVDIRTDTKVAGAPAGLSVDIDVPQNEDPDGLATPDVKDVTVALPDGMALSPGAADGLNACSDEQIGLSSRAPSTCPESSKIGTVTITTPLLDVPVSGDVYFGTQKSSDPASGEMYRLFLEAEGAGVRIKLPGAVKVNPSNGQITTTFASNPQLPFDHLKMTLKGGPRATLVNPSSCGLKTATANITSYAGNSVDASSAFVIDQGCATGRFAPTFEAGTVNPQAGAYSPFTMTIRRADGDQDLSGISLALPSGLLGALGSVPLCGDAQAAAGTCPASSQVGTTTVSTGTGSNPFSLNGRVYAAGPYKGAPFSLSIVVPAKAGPLDLGTVVVRSPLQVDAAAAKVAAPSDPLPPIVGGVPLHYRMVNVTLDRPGFMFNSTSCEPTAVNATLTSTGGATSALSSRYQAAGCSGLPLDPDLSLAFTGKGATKDGSHPAVVADLKQQFGQTNLKQVKVTLPGSVALEPENAQALCTPAQAAARACPAASIVGRATARTPALHQPLSGDVYFVEGKRLSPTGRVISTLPKLWLKLSGEGVPLDLWANSDVDDDGRLVSTFINVPDAPVTSFHLEIFGGQHGILAANSDICLEDKGTTAVYDGQSGKQVTKDLKVSVPECKPSIGKTTVTATQVKLQLTGLSAGKLTMTSSSLGKVTRTLKSADHATLTGKLTAKARKTLAENGKLTVKIKVSFKPKTGKAVTINKTVTFKKAKASKKASVRR